MKQYVKPDIYYEPFELSQHIAACGIDVNSADTSICNPTLDPDFWGGLRDQVFNKGTAGCNTAVEDIEVYCYTVGTSEAGRTFNS